MRIETFEIVSGTLGAVLLIGFFCYEVIKTRKENKLNKGKSINKAPVFTPIIIRSIEISGAIALVIGVTLLIVGGIMIGIGFNVGIP